MIAKNLPDGKQVQAVVISKQQFPQKEDAFTWVRDAGGDTSDFEDSGVAWTFHQFPLSKCVGRPMIMNTETHGVAATVGKMKTAKQMVPGDINAGNSGASGAGAMPAMDHDQLPTMSAGASFLTKMAAIADHGISELERHKGLMDHPEVRKFADTSHEELTAGREHLKGCMKNWYPEVKFDGMGDEEDDGNEYKALYTQVRKSIGKALDEAEQEHNSVYGEGFKPGSGVAHMKMPLGARALVKAMDHVHYAHKSIQDELPMQEHPEVKALAEHLNEELPNREATMMDMVKTHYPDVHKALGWDAEDEDDPSLEHDEEQLGQDLDDDGEVGEDDEHAEAVLAEDEAEPETEEPAESESESESGETESESEPAEDDDEKEKPAEKRKSPLYSMKQLKNGEHFIRKCTCGKVIEQCRCSSKGIAKTLVITKGGCVACRAKFAKKKAVKKALPAKTKLGPNQVEPAEEMAAAVGDIDILAVVQAAIDFFEEIKTALGGPGTEAPVKDQDGDRNPYETPVLPATGKDHLADEDEELEPKVTKDGDEEEDEETGFTKSQMDALLKRVSSIDEGGKLTQRRLGMLVGGKMN